MNRIVLITGGTKGIGLAVARAFLQQGDTVIGASRQPAEAGFPVYPLDLLDDESIRRCVADVLERYGRIDVLVSSAGVGIGGVFEDYSFDQLERECALNLLGTAKLTAAVLPSMRAQGFGRILFIGSVAGRIPIPFQTMYSASKAALAAMSDALRLELRGSGVQCGVIEPGDTATGFTAARTFAENRLSNQDSRRLCERALNAMMLDELHGKSPDTVAKTAVRMAARRRMPGRSVVCVDYKLLCLAARLLPRRMVEYILGKLYLESKKDAGFQYTDIKD